MRGTVTKNKKDSAGRRLGLKKYGGEEARQRGYKWKPGENVHVGKDQTLHSTKEGKVVFSLDNWLKKKRVIVNVVEQEVPNRKIFSPYPFMYHPELYPDLAKNNAKVDPLKFRTKHYYINLNKNTESKQQKKPEMTVLSKYTLEDDDSMRSIALNKRQVLPTEHTKYHEITNILDDISKIGVEYFIPDIKRKTQENLFINKLYLAEQYQNNPNVNQEVINNIMRDTDYINHVRYDIEKDSIVYEKPKFVKDIFKHERKMGKIIDLKEDKLPEKERNKNIIITRQGDMKISTIGDTKEAILERMEYLKELSKKESLNENVMSEYNVENEEVAKAEIEREIVELESALENLSGKKRTTDVDQEKQNEQQQII